MEVLSSKYYTLSSSTPYTHTYSLLPLFCCSFVPLFVLCCWLDSPMSILCCWWLDPPAFCIVISMTFIICWCARLSYRCIAICVAISSHRIVISSRRRASSASLAVRSASLELCSLRCCIIIIPKMFDADIPPSLSSGYSVGPKYEFVLIDKGIVERVAVSFSGYHQ